MNIEKAFEMIKERLKAEATSQPDLNTMHDITNEDDAICYGRKDCAISLLAYIDFVEGDKNA
jgi:hypothetical protein